jgi:endonuclease YncB( thermonuclease family)
VYEYIAVVRSVHDGDSFRADVDLGFGIWARGIPFRLAGIQAWELGSAEGRAARDFARGLMPVGAEIVIRTRRDTREKYGRMLATVLTESGDVCAALVAAGFAVPWEGDGKKPEPPQRFEMRWRRLPNPRPPAGD